MSQMENPYSPPNSDILMIDEKFPKQIVMVGSGIRFLNYLIDIVLFYVFMILIGIILGLTLGEHGVRVFDGCTGQLLGTLILVGYYILFEGIWGQTLGKMITKTIVVDESGNKPTIGQIIGRSFSRLIPFEAFSCFGRQSRGWHDSLSKTYVVKKAST
jgi:uncharacterized RDD family membrane protein YckC